MADVAHSIIIGDNLGHQLAEAMRALPATGAIFDITTGVTRISSWTDDGAIKGAVDKNVSGGAHAPDVGLVSLGRWEIFEDAQEPYSAEKLQDLAANVGKVLASFGPAGIKNVAWIMPPLFAKEGKVRSVILKALTDKGVRIFPGNRWSDTKSTVDDMEPNLPDEIIGPMAVLLANWVPLGSPFLRGAQIAARHGSDASTGPTGTIATIEQQSSAASTRAASWWSELSTGKKMLLGAGVIGLVGGAVYAVNKYG